MGELNKVVGWNYNLLIVFDHMKTTKDLNRI